MFNPLAKDPNSLSDDELQETISGLQKKYLIASRTPNQSVLFQLQNSLTMYSEEQRKRSSDKLREQQSKDDGNNLGELINVQ
jgi:hypothetical protein|tara:strand:+ start:514 stop:759 length:246 start_codon:yes stop_codon:yes gene_type:complete